MIPIFMTLFILCYNPARIVLLKGDINVTVDIVYIFNDNNYSSWHNICFRKFNTMVKTIKQTSQ